MHSAISDYKIRHFQLLKKSIIVIKDTLQICQKVQRIKKHIYDKKKLLLGHRITSI